MDVFSKALKRDKKSAKATHSTKAMLPAVQAPMKSDDGEAGAGVIVLRMVEREDLRDHVVVVTRWYEGKHLGGDRFRRMQDCVSAYLSAPLD